VLIKQVPDTKRITGKAMNEDGTVNRSALPAIFNPEDLNALELALHIREKFGGKITVITMGLPAAGSILRDSLYRGADEAILITIDGDTAQVGPQLAEKLGTTQITYVEQLEELSDRTITVRRNIGNGWQRIQTKLPVLLTVTGDTNEPRVAAAKRMMRYKKARASVEVQAEVRNQRPEVGEDELKKLVDERCKQLEQEGLLIRQWGLDFLEADLTWCGRSGSPTKVHRIQSVVLAAKESKQVDPTEQGISEMIHDLIEDRIIA
jgi:electron transfer flavoprotein beta subunit